MTSPRTCNTCKWGGGMTCAFPLPSWLSQVVEALDRGRGLTYAGPGGRPLVNEIDPDRPYTACPTWEGKP